MATLFCCCCGPCCSQIGTACGKFIGTRKITQLSYISLVLSFVVPVSLLTFLLNDLKVLKKVTFGVINVQTPTQVLIRMSFALFIVFLLMLLLMLCRNKVSQVINQGLFCVKFTILVALFILTFFLPTSVLGVYASISRIASILFMVILTIILIDLFYLYAINVVRRYEEGSDAWAALLIGATVCAYALSFFLVIMALIQFSNDVCGSTSWLSIVTIVILLLLPAIQLLGFHPQGNLLTTALIGLLISYTSYAAQEYFVTGCIVRLTTAGFIVDVVISLFLFSLSMYGSVMGGFSSDQYEDRPLPLPNDPNQAPQQRRHPESEDTIYEYTDHWGWVRWHLYMCLGVMYIGMELSNWQFSTNIIGHNLQGNSFVYWLKAIVSWFTALVYIWTLIAPKLFPNKNWRFQ